MAYAPTDPHAGAYAQYDRNVAAMKGLGDSVMSGVKAYQDGRESDMNNQIKQMALDDVKKKAAYQQGLADYLKNAQGAENPAYAQHMAAYTPEASAYSQLSPQAQQFVQVDAGPSSDMIKGQQDLAMASKPMPQQTLPPDYGALSQAYAMKQGNIPEYMRMEEANKAHDQKTINEIMGLAGKLKEMGLPPNLVTPLITSLAGNMKSPKMKELFTDLTIDKNWGGIKSTVAVDGTEGYVDPITGKPLMRGVYDLKFDGNAKPVSAKFVKELTKNQDADTAKLQNQMEMAKLRSETALSIAGMRQGNGGSGTGGKPPAGYRYTPDGNLEAIPGGPADIKQETAMQGRETGKATIQSTIDTIDKLVKHPGKKSSMGASATLDLRNRIQGTDAYDFKKELESFDSQLFLANISKMKGMGALSDAEGKKISSAAGAIKPGVSQKTFDSNMKTIKDTLDAAKRRMEQPNRATPPAGRKTSSDPMGIL